MFENSRILLLCLLIVLVICCSYSFGQVKHNYQVGPNTTSCDSISLTEMNLQESILEIENATFRFKQQFKISRVEGIRSARFFSCDGITGYLILIVSNMESVYLDVPKIKWDDLITNPDINQYFIKEIKDSYFFISDE